MLLHELLLLARLFAAHGETSQLVEVTDEAVTAEWHVDSAAELLLPHRALAKDDSCSQSGPSAGLVGSSSCALDALQRRAWRGSSERRPVLAMPSPLVWLHIPKCGTSFINTLLHQPGTCPGLPEDLVVDGERPLDILGELYPDLEPYCPGSFLNGSAVGFHFGLGADYESFKGKLMVFLRNPEQRLISSYHHDQHDWPFATPAGSLLEYARVVQGCAVRMFTRSGKWLENAPNVCGGPEPVTAEEVSEARRRLWDGFVFVGLTDHWNLSICLFHTMFGGQCRDTDFQNNRPGREDDTVKYDAASDLGSFVDEADGELFASGRALFMQRLREFGVSPETCGWCFSTPPTDLSTHLPVAPEHGISLKASGAKSAAKENLCAEGRLLPELYLLGAPKCGTTSLAHDLQDSGMAAALWTDKDEAKEFHFFDCAYVPCSPRWLGTRELWLEKLPSCPDERSVLADYTPHNLRLVSLPPGVNPSTQAQGIELPSMLARWYGEPMRQRLVFVVLLGEPLQRSQSAYYHAKAENFIGVWHTIPEGPTFEESLRKDLRAAQASPPSYSDAGLWANMYSRHLTGFLRHFAASQFIVVPMMAYLHGGGSIICEELSRRLAMDLCRMGDWEHSPHENSHDHPLLEEDISPALRADFEDFMRPEHENLLEVLAEAHQDGMQLVNYSGAMGSKAEIDVWLRRLWD